MAISAVVGAVLATVALIGGVNAAKGDQKPVAQTELYQYSSQ
ncbi:DUF2613 family protein [Nocardioides sp. R-C-SC26]|nr:DUF2613 family protein [Nocardioides sp. R-C-SC26]